MFKIWDIQRAGDYLSRQSPRCLKGISILKEIFKKLSLMGSYTSCTGLPERLLPWVVGNIMWEQLGEVV